MKKILLILAAMLLLTGCDNNSENDKPTEEVAEVQDEGLLNVPLSELYGTWRSQSGSPLVINSDGTAESMVIDDSCGSCSVNNGRLTIFWREDYSEVYKIQMIDGEVSLVIGEEPFRHIYKKD